MGGISVGKFNMFVQNGDGENQTAAVDLGKITIAAKRTEIISRRLDKNPLELRLDYVGLNGQLSEMAVPLNADNSYFLLLGSSGLDVGNVRVGSSSEMLSIDPRTFPGTYGTGIGTLGFEVSVSAEAQPGEYSLLIRNETGARRYLIGALTVERFPNFWSSAAFK
jgi:hypothetical protein